MITAAGVLLLTWPRRAGAAFPDGLWQRESVLPGWSIGRLWRLSLISRGVIAACDAASGPHLILIGLLIIGPVSALLTARWTLTAAASCLVIAFGSCWASRTRSSPPSPSTYSWPPWRPSGRPLPSARRSSSTSVPDYLPDKLTAARREVWAVFIR